MYFKDSEQIEDLLTTMGAGLGAMEYMNAKIEKRGPQPGQPGHQLRYR